MWQYLNILNYIVIHSKMLRIILLLFIIWVALATRLCEAQTNCDTDFASVETQHHNCVAFLSRGDIAPFDGSLITQKTGSSLGFKLEQCQLTAIANLAKSDAECVLEKKLIQDTLNIKIDALEAKLALIDNALDDALERVPWFRSKTVVFVLGVVVGGLVLYGGSVVASNAGK